MTRDTRQPLVDSRLHNRVELRFEGAALLRVDKHFGCNAATLIGVGEKLVHDVIGVKRLDSKFV